jgi:hypothetical protein
MLLIVFCSLVVLIRGNNEPSNFGFVNHQTQWYFHCPANQTTMLSSPPDEQPFVSYRCPSTVDTTIDVLPVELDVTFLCRLQSRFIWIIIDLYQYNTLVSFIQREQIDIRIRLNDQYSLTDSRSEIANYTNRLILINAFYIPFESIAALMNEQIQINIIIKNVNQLNYCEFIVRDTFTWQTFIDQQCHSTPTKTLTIEHAKCHFYSKMYSRCVSSMFMFESFVVLLI